MHLSDLLNEKIAFITVKGVFDKPDGERLLGFYVFIDNEDKTTLDSFWCVLPANEAITFLTKLYRKGVPSNYYTFELQDEVVLSQIKNETNQILMQVDSPGVYNISLRLNKDSFNRVLYQLVSENAQILIKEKYYPMYNLVFNRKNLNISLKYLDEEIGFSTMPLYETLTRNITVKTLNSLEDIKYSISKKMPDNSYQTHINFNEIIGTTKYEIFVNEHKLDIPFISRVMDIEWLMYLANKFFREQVYVQIYGALFNLTHEQKLIPTRSSSGSSSVTKTICEISPLYKIPTQKEIVNLFKKYQSSEKTISFDNNSLLEEASSFYPRIIVNIIKNVLEQINGHALHIISGVCLEEHNIKCAQAGLILHALKGNLYTDEVFLKMFSQYEIGGNIGSAVFDIGLKIKS